MEPAGEAQARAEELLASHLRPHERAEFAATGRLVVVKHGLVWSILLRQLAVVLPLAPLLAIPASRAAAVVLLATIVIALAPFWVSRFALATTRRREWIISSRSPPVVRARGRAYRFCVRFTEELPPGDRVLAWKNLIEVCEPRFLRTANVL